MSAYIETLLGDPAPVVILGNPASVFPRHLAQMWRALGLDVKIVTRGWSGPTVFGDETPVLCSAEVEGPLRRRGYHLLSRVLSSVEEGLIARCRVRYSSAMGCETEYRPAVSGPVINALSISRFVRALRPQLVCGQEVLAYGLATAFCTGVPRLLMPWGGDIYMYAETTALAFAIVKYALRHVDLVVPGSPVSFAHLRSRFDVEEKRLHAGGLWTLDRARFRRASIAERGSICQRFGIDPRALVVMNVRRFLPAWGSGITLKAFVAFARECPTAHFVLLAGAGAEPHVAAARRQLATEGLLGRFTLFDGDITLDQCGALMSVADIAVSIMRERDMSPVASILQAVAAGGLPVLSDQEEYRYLERQGLRALFVRPDDPDAVIGALRVYASHPERCRRMAEDNGRFLSSYDDAAAATDLLERVAALKMSYNRGGRPT